MADNKVPISPAGIAKFPHLNDPSTKFKPEGEYQVTLLLDGEEAEKLKEFIDNAMEENFNAVVEAFKTHSDPKQRRKAGSVKMAAAPYAEDVDSDGEETGYTAFRFKTGASGTTKAGKPWKFKLPLFDAKRKPTNAPVGGGSTIKIAYEPFPYYTELVGAGISMRLKAVQVLDLKVWGERSAEGYGFAEEDGYEAEVANEEGGEFETVNDGETDF